MMRKLLAIVLALTLALSMATVAFAATIEADKDNPLTDANNKADAEVTIIIDNSSLPEKPEDVDPNGPDADAIVYNVDIDAAGAVFTYTFGDKYDPDLHRYTEGSWDTTTGNIVVTNNSNTSITFNANWKEGGNNGIKYGVTATLSNNTNITLASAVNTEENADSYVVPSANIGVTIDGAIPTILTSGDYTLDYVTVTIAAAERN